MCTCTLRSNRARHDLFLLILILPLVVRAATGFVTTGGTAAASVLQRIPAVSASTACRRSPTGGVLEYLSANPRAVDNMHMLASRSKTDDLRELLNKGDILVMPCCYDGLTARLVEDAGFPLTFMTGFGVSGAHGLPDTQLISYAEMLASATNICSTLREIPCIGDGDTGYGNSVNVKRTVKGYAQVGMAGIMIEDQIAPKRCGHTRGKSVVGREEAYSRVRAACDARDEGADTLIMARTDARAGLGLEEALERCREFRKIGADITFLEAPQSVEEMKRFCQEVDGPKLANMLEFGKTPILPPAELQEMGYTIAAYPLSLLSASIKAMNAALARLKAGEPLDDMLEGFEEVQRVVGFRDYDETAANYKID